MKLEAYQKFICPSPLSVHYLFLYTQPEFLFNCSQTNIPIFKVKESSVRRRYSDFEWLKKELERDSKVGLAATCGLIIAEEVLHYVMCHVTKMDYLIDSDSTGGFGFVEPPPKKKKYQASLY